MALVDIYIELHCYEQLSSSPESNAQNITGPYSR